MSATASPAAGGPEPTAPPTGSARAWAAVASLGLGIFILVTIEELPIGVLTLMSTDLGVSDGVAGLAVTLPGILAAAVALVTPVVTRGLNRRLVLVLALACVVLSCLGTVLGPGILAVLGSRVFAGIAIGLYWATLPVVAVRQVGPERAAQALTVAFAGTGGALVVGVPLGSWIGAHLGWREAFLVLGAVALAVLVLVQVLVRPVRAVEPTRWSDLAQAIRTPGVSYAVTLTALVISGQFITYGYVSPLLQSQVGVGAGQVALMLLVFGIAGLAGNFAVAPVIRREPAHAILVIAAGMALALLALVGLAHGVIGGAVAMAAWGFFTGGASVSIQSFVTRHSGRFEESGTALNSAMFNLAIAVATLVGGRLLDGVGIGLNVAVSVVLLLTGAVVIGRWLLTRTRVDA
ncbi:MFS transporter [Brachybacterium sp. AOP25-B2-12]|uniref:MFS transporter n=1 Tax=Brachybacterium sp. AOP25-B2-12 TaxID=3457710 RepID=UPI0040346389